MTDSDDQRRLELLMKRRDYYRERRQKLADLGVLPLRKPGRPRLRPPEEALEHAKWQKRESQRRTMERIREGLARLALEAV
jgi:hypothetical protein